MPTKESMKSRLRRVWRNRRFLVAWTAIGVLPPLGYAIWPFLGAPEPIIVSWNTTRLGEESIVNGQVDYGNYLADQLQDAGVPDITEDPWMEQAAQYPRDKNGWQMLDWGPLPGGLYTGIQKACIDAGITNSELLKQHPWSVTKYPGVAEVVRGNQEWYATTSAEYVSLTPFDWSRRIPGKPFSSSMLMTPARELNEAFAQRFIVRAALRFGSDDAAGAFTDIQFAYIIAARHRLDSQSYYLARRIESRISRLVINSLLNPEIWTTDTLQYVMDLPFESTLNEFAETLKRERYMNLDAIQRKRNGTLRFVLLVPDIGFNRPGFIDRLKSRRIRINTDWNAVMRAENEFHDELLVAMQQSNPAKMLSDARALAGNYGYSLAKTISERELWQAAPTTEEIIAAYSYFRSQSVGGLKAMIRRDLYRQIIRLTALLADSRHENGHFPETLKELRLGPESQPVPQSWLMDPFLGEELEYHTIDGGFVLRSVGHNQIRDHSEFLELQTEDRESPEEDQDILWRWPAADK